VIDCCHKHFGELWELGLPEFLLFLFMYQNNNGIDANIIALLGRKFETTK